MLVVSGFGDVPNPFDGLVVAFFLDAKEANSEPAGSEHRDLEVERDGGFGGPGFFKNGGDEVEFCLQHVFGFAGKPSDPPD